MYLAIAVAHARRKKLLPSTLRGCVGSDPLGTLAQEGRLSSPLEVIYDEMAVAAEWAEKNAPGIRTMAVSTRPYADGGASAVEEIGVALATATAYVRALVQRGIHPEAAIAQVWFSFSLGPQFFMEIAKLRAVRVAWAECASAFGVPHGTCGMVMHVRTSSYDMTTVDPYVNMLRTTTEALSGAVGGCQSMHIGPFDEPVRLPDDFSRRIARNAHVLLRSESYIDRVADPAGGSWYVEALTGELASAGWTFFQEIEKAGGMEAALGNGMVQERIGATAVQRADALAHRKDVMVGVSTFANPLEIPLEERSEDLDAVRARRAETLRSLRTVPDRAEETAVKERLSRIMETGRDSIMNALIDAAAQGATIGEMGRAWRTRRGGGPIEVSAIPSRRRSVPYEELRAASYAYTHRTGHPPKVFLATMGPLAQYKVRADFSSDFVAAAGCLAQVGTGYATPEDAVEAAVISGARAVVICSTDDTYPLLVPAFCSQLKARDPSVMILLAGYPQEHIAGFTAAGIEEFIHVRADLIVVLRHMLRRMEVMA
jgi:methylmalonyl-CoA mutase